MPLAAAAFFAAALVLGGAGIAKAARPEAVTRALRAARLPGRAALDRLPVGRVAGTIEVVVAAFALAYGDRVSAALVAAIYAVFALVAVRLLVVAAGESCGCFGSSDTPVTVVHVVLDVAAVALGAVSLVSPPGGVLDVAADRPLAGVPFVAASVALAYVAYVGFTAVSNRVARGRRRRRAGR